MRKLTWLWPLLVLAAIMLFWRWQADPAPTAAERAPVASATVAGDVPAASRRGDPDLPAEAHATLELIRRGGPFPHRQDGTVFANREGHLPRQPRGWYREYTVATPGLSHRGTRRIVTGGQPPREWYYTDDHYRSFRRIQVQP
ncbi:ribonuclease domain-containing protein [Luteimonas sp. e5]